MDEYVIKVPLFGKTDSPCCANWALKRTAIDQEKNFSPEIAKAGMKNFYMDDYLDSFNYINKAIYTTHCVTKMLYIQWRILLNQMDIK